MAIISSRNSSWVYSYPNQNWNFIGKEEAWMDTCRHKALETSPLPAFPALLPFSPISFWVISRPPLLHASSCLRTFLHIHLEYLCLAFILLPSLGKEGCPSFELPFYLEDFLSFWIQVWDCNPSSCPIPIIEAEKATHLLFTCNFPSELLLQRSREGKDPSWWWAEANDPCRHC